jgi:hypothetical protein
VADRAGAHREDRSSDQEFPAGCRDPAPSPDPGAPFRAPVSRAPAFRAGRAVGSRRRTRSSGGRPAALPGAPPGASPTASPMESRAVAGSPVVSRAASPVARFREASPAAASRAAASRAAFPGAVAPLAVAPRERPVQPGPAARRPAPPVAPPAPATCPGRASVRARARRAASTAARPT